MGQFMYIACVDCHSYKWLDKLSTEGRKNELVEFMRFKHPCHKFLLIGEDDDNEPLLDQYAEDGEEEKG